MNISQFVEMQEVPEEVYGQEFHRALAIEKFERVCKERSYTSKERLIGIDKIHYVIDEGGTAGVALASAYNAIAWARNHRLAQKARPMHDYITPHERMAPFRSSVGRFRRVAYPMATAAIFITTLALWWSL